VQTVPSTRTVDSYYIDLEWKKGVEASIMSLRDGQDNTLKVLRELLSKLDSSKPGKASNIEVI
jgi:hypothetical protein